MSHKMEEEFMIDDFRLIIEQPCRKSEFTGRQQKIMGGMARLLQDVENG